MLENAVKFSFDSWWVEWKEDRTGGGKFTLWESTLIR